MAALLVVTGPPGAGKSTVAARLAEQFEPSVLIEGDCFFNFLRRGAIDPWLPESDRQNDVVTRAAAGAAGTYTTGDYTVLYDGILGPWYLPTFATATGLDALHYVMLLPSVERCVAGVATRLNHGFTDEVATRKMHHEFAKADIDARHVLVDPPDGVDATADRILDAFSRDALRHDVPVPG